MALPALPVTSVDAVRHVAGCLRRAGFDEATYRVGLDVLPGVADAARLPLVAARLGSLGPAGCLTALLAFGLPQARGSLPAEALETLLAAGLVTEDRDVVSAPWRLTPMAGLLVVSDHPSNDPERVMTPGGTTTELAWALPRPPGRRVLDVGTGSGALALLGAAQGAHAVATDVSARACAFAAVSAALSGVTIDVRQGSLLEPVEGERFDLVVSQPPFIPRPASLAGATWLHAGPDGDELALALLSGLPRVLAAGGAAVLRCDLLPERASAAYLQDRAGLGDLDVVVVSWPGSTSEQLAYGYAAIEDAGFGDRYAHAVTAYAQHLQERQVESVRGALVLVRRRSGGLPAVGTVTSAAALTWEQLQARAAALAMAEQGDALLLRARVRAADTARVTWEQDLTGGSEVGHVLRFPAGSSLEDAPLTEQEALLLQLTAGGRGVAALVAGYAEQLGRAPEAVVVEVVAFVRDALRTGRLLPAD